MELEKVLLAKSALAIRQTLNWWMMISFADLRRDRNLIFIYRVFGKVKIMAGIPDRKKNEGIQLFKVMSKTNFEF